MNIRPAETGDVGAIAAIWNAAIRESTETFTSVEKTDAQVKVALGGKAPFLVVDDGALLGFGTYGDFRPGPGYALTVEHSIYVAQHARGSGIGRLILKRLEEAAAHANMHSMIAGISGENSPAIRFHQSCGYDLVAKIPEVGFKFGRFHDLLLMQKFLT